MESRFETRGDQNISLDAGSFEELSHEIAEVQDSEIQKEKICELSESVIKAQKAIINFRNYYLKVRASSLRTMKPTLQARRSIIAGVKIRLEEIRFLYRVSLTKRFQIYRRSKSSTFEEIHVNSSPLEYQMLHLNPSQLMIHPEHFPRTQNSSGLPTLAATQKKTSHPPSNSQKHTWINYKVIRSVSSSVSPERRHSPPRQTEQEHNPMSKSLTSLWEGTEYKLQLLASLYEKLMIKLIWELWNYPIYVTKVLKISEKNIHRLEEQTLKQLTFSCFQYHYYGSKLLELRSLKTAKQYLFRKKVIPLFYLWRDRNITMKVQRQQAINLQLDVRHFQFQQRQAFKQWMTAWFHFQKRKVIADFAREYSSLQILLVSWKKWQEMYLSKHFLRLEMMKLYHPGLKTKEGDDSAESLDISVFKPDQISFVLRYYQQELIKKYTTLQSQLFRKFGRRFPYRFQRSEMKEVGQEDLPVQKVAIMGNYLKQHSRTKRFELLLHQATSLVRQAVQSKRVLPQARFDSVNENGPELGSPSFPISTPENINSSESFQKTPMPHASQFLSTKNSFPAQQYVSSPSVQWSPSFQKYSRGVDREGMQPYCSTKLITWVDFF